MKNISKIVSSFLIIFTLFGPLTSFAIAEPYDPGETLDPACVPNEVNCFVVFEGDISVMNSSTLYSSTLTGSGSGSTATEAIFLGTNAGLSATSASNSIFLGPASGSSATNASYSNFLGASSGAFATDAASSNFIGRFAGMYAASATDANFFGTSAGHTATNAASSNFIGNSAGNTATNAAYSNFIGISSGYGATDASYSNFIGNSAGYGATNASYSTLIGYQAGRTFVANNLGFNNIIIGTNVSLPNATSSGINIGGILFGSGAYSNTIGNPSITAVSTGKIGIGDVTPDYRLDVEDTTIDNNIFSLTDSDGTCTYNPEAGTVTVNCSSDERLKTNITDGASALDYFKDFKIKQYDVRASNDHMTGVIAQEVIQTHPELVSTDSNGYYSVTLPNSWQVIKAIQELDIKIKGITNYEPVNFQDTMLAWLGDANNKIENLFTKNIHTEKVCIKKSDGTEVCIDGDKLDSILNNSTITESIQQTENTDPIVNTEAVIVEEDKTIPEITNEIEINPEIIEQKLD